MVVRRRDQTVTGKARQRIDALMGAVAKQSHRETITMITYSEKIKIRRREKLPVIEDEPLFIWDYNLCIGVLSA